MPFPTRYEFLSSQQVADIVGAALGEKSSAEAACVTLIEQAARLWRREEGDHRDDITAIVVRLNPFDLTNNHRSMLFPCFCFSVFALLAIVLNGTGRYV